MNLLRALDPKLYDRIQPYKVTKDADMPWAYQTANSRGRPLHDDWAIFKNVRRIYCAYRVPLPFHITGDVRVQKKWILWDLLYPTAPGTPVEYMDYYTDSGVYSLPHALVDYAGYGTARYSAFIGGEWVPDVFVKHTSKWFGRRFSCYKGLHQDLHVSPPSFSAPMRSDLMCWFPEVAASFVKET